MGNDSNACVPKVQKRCTEVYFRISPKGYGLRGYRFGEKYNVLELIQEISKSAYEIVKVNVHENCDIGCELYSGSYSLEDFCAKYPTFEYPEDIDRITLTMSNRCSIYLSKDNDNLTDYLTICSDGGNATIEDFISC